MLSFILREDPCVNQSCQSGLHFLPELADLFCSGRGVENPPPFQKCLYRQDRNTCSLTGTAPRTDDLAFGFRAQECFLPLMRSLQNHLERAYLVHIGQILLSDKSW